MAIMDGADEGAFAWVSTIFKVGRLPLCFFLLSKSFMLARPAVLAFYSPRLSHAGWNTYASSREKSLRGVQEQQNLRSDCRCLNLHKSLRAGFWITACEETFSLGGFLRFLDFP